jgi:hypothetical protein
MDRGDTLVVAAEDQHNCNKMRSRALLFDDRVLGPMSQQTIEGPPFSFFMAKRSQTDRYSFRP